MQHTSQRSWLRSSHGRRRLLQHRRNFMRRRFCLCDLSRRKRTDPRRSQSCGVHRTGETVAGPHARMMCSFEAIPVNSSPHHVGERTTPGLPAAGSKRRAFTPAASTSSSLSRLARDAHGPKSGLEDAVDVIRPFLRRLHRRGPFLTAKQCLASFPRRKRKVRCRPDPGRVRRCCCR